MAGNTLYIYTDFHTSTLSAVDTTVCRLCGNYEFRTDFIFVDDVLPAQTVTVLFLNSSDYHDLASFRNQIKVFHDLCTVCSGNDTAALIGYTTTADLLICLVSIVWIKVPVFNVSDTYSIDMCIVSDDLVTGSHVTDNVTLRIDNNFVEVKFFHLGSDCLDMSFFITALARILYDST